MTVKQEEHYLKTLSKIFNKIPIKDRITETITDNLSVLDKSNVYMLTSISSEGREILKHFINKEENNTKDINIKYEFGKGNYNGECLKKAMKVFENDENVKIETGYEQPITINNEHFKIIIAPRME